MYLLAKNVVAITLILGLTACLGMKGIHFTRYEITLSQQIPIEDAVERLDAVVRQLMIGECRLWDVPPGQEHSLYMWRCMGDGIGPMGYRLQISRPKFSFDDAPPLQYEVLFANSTTQPYLDREWAAHFKLLNELLPSAFPEAEKVASMHPVSRETHPKDLRRLAELYDLELDEKARQRLENYESMNWIEKILP